MTEENYYQLWERFALSEIAQSLPNDVEEFCKQNEITVDYFIEEWL
jgi:hypothetical protein